MLRSRLCYVYGEAYSTNQGYLLVKLDFDWQSAPREDYPERDIPQRQDALQFHDGLIPFHSPLLRESQLFSFPPLINMFKFGG